VFSVPYTFVGTMKQEGAKLLLGGFGTKALVGDYGFALRLTTFPVSLVAGGIRPVLYQKAANQTRVRESQAFIETTLYWLSLFTIPVCIAFIMHTEAILRLVVGDEWLGAAPYTRILAVPALAFVHTNWMDRMLDALQRQRLALGLEATFSILGLAALAAGLFGLANPRIAVGAQCAVHAVSSIVFVIATYHAGGLEMRGLARYGLCFFAFAATSLALILIVDAVAPWFIAAPAGILLSYAIGVLLIRRLPAGGVAADADAQTLPLQARKLGPQGGFPA
jgi:O-antigen/teichoic acid export membrane protein